MKKTSAIILFAIVVVTAFGFATIGSDQSKKQTQDQTEAVTANEKQGITQTGAW